MKKYLLLICVSLLCSLYFTSSSLAATTLVLPTGEKRTYNMALPDGYYWLEDGSLVTPQAVIIDKDGNIEWNLTARRTTPAAIKNVKASPLLLPDDCLVTYESSDADLYNKTPGLSPVAQAPYAPQVNGRSQFSRPDDGALTIPEYASENSDLSFLEGCWRANEMNYYTDPKRPYKAPAEFCFKRSGAGSFYAFPKGTQCISEATAHFEGSTLLLNTGKGTCAQKGRFLMPRTFRCEGYGENTVCYIIAEYKNQVYQDIVKFYKK